MAELSLSFDANRVLELVRKNEDIKKKMMGSLGRGGGHELLQGLEETISKLAPLLIDAEMKSFHDEGLKDWLRRLGEALYGAQNLLDDFSTAALQRTLMTNPQKVVKVTRKVFHCISNRLTTSDLGFKVLTDLKEMASDPHESILLNERSGEVYGRDDDREAIVMQLRHGIMQGEGDVVTVLPIIGIGGLGKTTLAQYVFNDRRIQSDFKIRIWLRFSSDFSVRKIFEEIVGETSAAAAAATVAAAAAATATIGSMEDLYVEQLQNRLTGSLPGKRCLIVLDDMWKEDPNLWPELNHALRNAGALRGSALILTSRSLNVEDIAGAIQPHELKPLTKEQSWNLFQRISFGDPGSHDLSNNSELISIGRQIVRRCNGHPYLITVAGSFLCARGRTVAEWWNFYDKEFSRIKLLFTKAEIPKLSYDRLSSPLIHCIAYCSLLPKDHEIDMQTLIQLWIALGLIPPPTSKDQSLEDVGRRHFQSLVDVVFFHQDTRHVRELVKLYKMNDSMHKLANSAAGEHCLTINFPTNSPGTLKNVSHVSIGLDPSSTVEIIDLLKGAEKLQSILLRSNSQIADIGRLADEILETIISACRFLRVLDMRALGITKVPSSIGNLTHLRYLNLSENGQITELPNSINKLLNLQTLKLSSCFELRKLPKDIGSLTKLRHLEIDECHNLESLPQGINKLTNLQTLSQVVLSEDASTRRHQLEQLRRLKNLKGELVIKNLKHGEDEIATILQGNLGVRSLSLEWESQNSDTDTRPLDCDLFSDLEELALNGFRGEKLFKSETTSQPSFPSKLVKLSLRRWEKGKNLPSLSKCSNLKVLVLDEMIDLEYVESGPVSTKTTIFPALQELWLTELPKLKWWWEIEVESKNLPSFSCLSKLVIEDCGGFASMPRFPDLEEGLVLDSTSWNLFELTMPPKSATAAGEASLSPHVASSSKVPSSIPLSKLKNLCIVGITMFDADEVVWTDLKSLRMLKFDSLPRLMALPERLQHVSSLVELHVWRSGVREIPDWLGELKFLEKLVIRACPKIETLPEMKGWRLQTLEIQDCPTIIRRCEEKTGADWDKIKHIPNLNVGASV